jgi:general stress protein YciG
MTGKGFAGMTPEQQREIASKGGKAAHANGSAHKFTSEEAKVAGTKGGNFHSREHMRELGRKGGLAKQRNVREKREKGTP